MFLQFQAFDESIELFAAYVKRLEQSFILRDMKEEKKVPAVISILSKVYNSLCNLSFPKSSKSLKYTQIVAFLIKFLSLSQNKFCDRIKFRKCFQIVNFKIFLLDFLKKDDFLGMH